MRFKEHVEGVVASVGDGAGVVPEWYEAPTFYFTNPYAVVGPYDDVPVPPGSQLLDFELEVAAVVGRDGASLTPEQARDHIFGYTILNDWSARDLQRREMKVTWVRAGDVLGSGTCGNGGCLAELWGRRGRLDPPPLQPGDVVEMTVEGIGTIRNTVVPGAELPPVRPARPRPRTRKRTP
jgi:2-keto-4-pentenoate hydratase/2-oxohepta-3-ene-1,7-dioic acid hydratase in catechol pathway